MRFTVALGLTIVLQAPAAAQQPTPMVPPIEFTVEVLGSKLLDFSIKMEQYAALRRSLEEGLPPLVVTDRPSDILKAEHLLARRIQRARAGARRGDIFTDDIRRGFRQLLRPVTNQGTCEAVRDDNPGEFGWDVNDDYPKDQPLSTVPPSMLEVLPRLPGDVYYRFLNRDLILHDARANVILDRIDDAIRCP
jgi:hypothetical protein